MGAGTGMACLGWKGGIGTSSRVLPDGHVVGVLLLCNFGQWDRLTFDGVAVGRALGRPAHQEPPPAGSCLGVVVTDAPLDGAACERLARRVGLGLARAGSTAHHSRASCSLRWRPACAANAALPALRARCRDARWTPYFEAVVDAAEESVLGCLLAAQDTAGRAGRSIAALPVDRVREILRAEGRGCTGG